MSFLKKQSLSFTLIVLLLILAKFNPAVGQSTKLISGSVIDATTKESLPFVTVTLKKSLIGTVTNENGFFDLKYPDDITNDSLFITLLGFQSVTLPLSDIKDSASVSLLKSDIELKEVVIRPLPPTYYIKQAIANLKQTNPKDPFQTQAYYREIMTENGNFIVSNEAVFKTFYPSFQDTIKNQHQALLFRKADDIKEVAFMKAQRDKKAAKKEARAKKKGKILTEEESKGIAANFGGPEAILRQADLSKSGDEYLDSTSFKHYEYTFAPSSSYDSKELMVINFKSKGKVDHSHQVGKIYIDIASNAIVKIEESGDFVIPLALRPVLFLYGFSIDDAKYSTVTEFQGVNNRWYPKNISFNLGAMLTKKHWFADNEHSLFEVESMFTVNKIKINGTSPIPKEKRFDAKKKIEPQVFNDEGLNWSEVNIIKK
jgi:CarboxypepD_reg-like domain